MMRNDQAANVVNARSIARAVLEASRKSSYIRRYIAESRQQKSPDLPGLSVLPSD
ncbi:MAG: hypothetical protein AB9M53_06685 [Leptothrix sp. (in: b-proteobacteria)]